MTLSYSNPCPVCGEQRIDRFRLYFDGFIKLFRCSTCGFVGHFSGPGTFRFPDYTAFYSEGTLPSDDQLYPTRFSRNLEDMIARIREHCPPPARVLDVGCFGGYFMTMLKSAGYDVHGVEASEAIASYAREKTGLPIKAGMYVKEMFGHEEFDVITLLHVFEHMPDPVDTLSIVRYHLRHGGFVVIDVPSLRNPLMLLYSLTRINYIVTRFRAWSAINPQHIAYYRPDSLRRVLGRAGFRVVEMATGRYSVKYCASSLVLHPLLRAIDALCQRFQVGTIFTIARK